MTRHLSGVTTALGAAMVAIAILAVMSSHAGKRNDARSARAQALEDEARNRIREERATVTKRRRRRSDGRVS